MSALVRPASDLGRIADIVPAVTLVHGDLLSADDVAKCVDRARPEICFHLAWYVEPGEYLTSLQNIPLLAASLNLASRLTEAGCRRLVATGTCFEYDTRLGYLSEESRLEPRSLYAASKLGLQLTLEQLGVVTGLRVAWARLFYQFGPFEDPRRLVPSVVRSLLASETVNVTAGEQVRDFLHIEDVALALWGIGRSDLVGPVNVGSGHPVTVAEIVTTIGGILGRRELIALGARPYDVSDPVFVCANNRRLKASTDWTPRFDLEEGLRHTVEWWRVRAEKPVHRGVRAW